MQDLEALVDRYCESWSAESAEDRERLLRASFTAEATYCDPRSGTLSMQELLAHISRVRQSRAGSKVERTSAVDVHHGLGRFQWHVVMPNGSTSPEGIDFIELAPDRRLIKRVVGFFGPLDARGQRA